MASNSLTTPREEMNHSVYLTFRGKDTGRNFTSHLYAALTRNCIDVFVDNERICGEEENPKIFHNKITESLVSVVIFSPNYSDSEWCLDELVNIIECKTKMGQVVLPIFVGVEPSHVRNQTGGFGDGFNRLINKNHLKDKEKNWRHALVEAANLSGWDCNERYHDTIVEEIVNRIDKILDQMSLNDQEDDGFVGISRVQKVESLLFNVSPESIHSVGIWGMGGIGKTRIANLVFNRISNKFEGSCFIANVRTKAERDGLDCVQNEMILQLLGFKGTSSKGLMYMLSPAIRRTLKRRKLLIVLDDVNNLTQLKALLGRAEFYGPGSRIIVTSRDKQLLINGCRQVYEVEKLNNHESLLLLKLNAFRENYQPTARQFGLLTKAIIHAQGLPLALEVFGCNLYGRGIKEWEVEFEKLDKTPDLEIVDILRMSYDGLDEKERSIFLDIACLFQGWEKNRVETILDACGFYAPIGLTRLLDRALIAISNEEIWMHDLLQQMGQDIVVNECIEEPGKRSRLWRFKDIYDVLAKVEGTEKVEAISLDFSKIKDLELRSTSFVGMFKLRILNFHKSCGGGIKIHLPEGLSFLPNELRYLHWDSYPLASLPPKFHPEHLVDLDLRESQIKHLWICGDEPYFPSLKYMDLCFSKNLSRLPDFSRTPVLERLVLSHCESLVVLPDTIQYLTKLKQLILEYNKNLSGHLNLSHLTNLEFLNLHGCKKIYSLSEIPTNVTSLTLNGIGVRELPSSIGSCHSKLKELRMEDSKKLVSLPSSICELKYLEWLGLNGCSRLESLPENLGNLESLKHLGLDGTAIRSLPTSIYNLKSLLVLQVGGCPNLSAIPDNFGNVEILHDRSTIEALPTSSSSNYSAFHGYMQYIIYKGKVSWFPSFTCLTLLQKIAELPVQYIAVGLASLVVLDLRRSDRWSLPESVKQLPNLTELYLKDCKNLMFIPELPSSIEVLDAVNCSSLTYMKGFYYGENQKVGRRLKFDFSNCFNLDRAPTSTLFRELLPRLTTIGTSHFPQEDPTDESGTARICIPGSEMPKWFEYSATGSTLRVKSFGRTLNLRQLVFCVVVEAPDYGPGDFSVECSCLLMTDSGLVTHVQRWHEDASLYSMFPTMWKFYDTEHVLRSEHVILGCDARPCNQSECVCYIIEASFKFYAVDRRGEVLDGCKVIKCGVTPIYTVMSMPTRRNLLLV